MDESAKTKKLWNDFERSLLSGEGLDIGCGPYPVTENVRRFDLEHGDANRISEHVKEDFDFVYASHCLEHMHDPKEAILEWWKLVRVGGHLIFIVPDEDLYEQGIFPSRFNPDHKATFTISKQKSWSPVSINVLDLAFSLPDSQLISILLQDQGYDRRLLKHGPRSSSRFLRSILKVYNSFKRRTKCVVPVLEHLRNTYITVDQTVRPDAVAQIQCIVKRTG